MKAFRFTTLLLLLLLLATAGYAQQQQSSMTISGVTYTKWLWGNQRYDGSLYNFTTVPGEGYGDNGQGTEIELLVGAKPNKYLEVSGRIHSRFSQNFWTNFGGFGGSKDATCGGPNDGGDCGEFDPRSNQYIKLRGMTVRVTPGWKYADAITFGATDLGMFDPFTIGKIRYIDRDNADAVFVQGSLGEKARYDLMRLSLPRLWAGPFYETGEYASQDAAYALQMKFAVSPDVDLTTMVQTISDIEVDPTDNMPDDGRDVVGRYANQVYTLKADYHPAGPFAVRGAFYHSVSDPNSDMLGTWGMNGYSPVPNAELEDNAYKVDIDINDPFQNGFSVNLEYFDIGEDYVSVLAARRESDVLLTEGHDATFALNGPSNGRYGVWGGNESSIGYAGWQGNMQQVATINVDNEFTDFDEPAAETVIGWKGFTIVPRWQKGDLEVAGEFTHIGYNTNWQAWGDPTRSIESPIYPAMDMDTGVGHSFRAAYSPFQDKSTDIALIRAKTTLDIGKGVDVFGKFKIIQEEDKRMNDARYLPYAAGDCPGHGEACKNVINYYSPGLTTAGVYTNPGVINVYGVLGYQWAPFDDLSDDDRDLDYKMIQVGAGYQLTDVIYGSLTLERYMAELKDGNTAFQAYRLHEISSGDHTKNKFIVALRYPIGGAEAGLNYEYAFGEFDPDFGDGFVPTYLDSATAAQVGLKPGTPGFFNRYGGWNSLVKREFDQQHLKAYFKVRF
jgi:hypothetical protein